MNSQLQAKYFHSARTAGCGGGLSVPEFLDYQSAVFEAVVGKDDRAVGLTRRGGTIIYGVIGSTLLNLSPYAKQHQMVDVLVRDPGGERQHGNRREAPAPAEEAERIP